MSDRINDYGLEAGSKGNTTILIAEDDPINLKIMDALLSAENYTICTVTDGQQCLDLVSHVRPDLILTDVEMPVLDGLETCRRLRADGDFQSIPIIFVTASTDDDILQAAFEAGGSDYVRKPVNRIELTARVGNALSQHQAMRKLADEEKLKGVLETAGGVCHELNQPLQYVLGAVQLLMMDVDEQDPSYGKLDAIRARVEQMGDITNKLTKITRYRTRAYGVGREIIDIDQSARKPTGDG